LNESQSSAVRLDRPSKRSPLRTGRWLGCLLLAAGSLTSAAGQSITASSDVDVPIPDGNGEYAYGSILIQGAPEGAVVTGVDVEWSVIHPYSGDLLISLTDQEQIAELVLWDYEGGSAPDPSGSASGVTVFNGLPVNGDWFLLLYDNEFYDEGYLDYWSLTIHYEVSGPGPFTLSAETPYCDQRDPATPAVPLSWTPSPGASYYDVYRDGALLVENLTGTTLLDVFGLAEGTQHTYFVRARGASASVDSNPVVVSIGDVCVDEEPEPEPEPELELEVEIGPETALATAQVEPEAPRVVFGPDGTKAVVWFQVGAGGTVIRVQFFDAQGQPITTPVRVDQVGGDNKAPTASFDDQGNLLVLWARDEAAAALGGDRVGRAAAQGSSVLGRSFSQNGQPLSNEGTVSTGATGESAVPESDSDRSGNSVVVWQDGNTIRARMLDPQGNPRSAVFDVNPGGSGSQPSIAVSASGDFVIAWRDGGSAIAMRRYRDDGQLLGGEQVSQAGSPANPAVAIDDAGNSIVVWDAVGVGRDIYAQRYHANGNRRGGTNRMNAGTAGDQTHPRVDVNAKGRFAVVWESTEGAPGNATVARSAGQSTLGRVFTPQGEPEHTEVEIATTDATGAPEKPDVSVNDKDDVAVVYERRGAGGQPAGIFRKDVDVTAPPGTCIADDTTLCLNESRFRVTALWEEPSTRTVNAGHAVPLTADTGYFWFFGSDNVEVVVKALGACPVNARFWVFAAGLTNVEVTLRVDDVVTGESRTYFNQRDAAFLPVLDSDAFATCDAALLPAVPLDEEAVAAVRAEVMAGLMRLATGDAPPAPALPAPLTIVEGASSAACAADGDSLCLAGNRFQVEVQFLTGGGQSGNGQATALTQDTGYFWFFDPDNVEIVVKVLNACSISDRFWVFAAGLTDVEAKITVIDGDTGERREYLNSLGTAFAPIQDTSAFATCP
jgi:subtilisin-like proprotein convertase family protein